ncbi:MAG: lipid A export permease/ATP-binding protein MsbA [Hylemonella sp.]|nr:lipid A export permease/ATP-binding protein MsbA [Hylemonella sp.]MDP1937986.1 lipid A export permease/ATP-binding protein MsbA [Hylemonella sp.]
MEDARPSRRDNAPATVMQLPIQVSSRALYFRLLTYLKPYWKVFALAVLGMVGTAATEPVFPAIMKYLLDQGFQTEDQRLVWLIPLGMVALFAVRGILSFCTSYLMTWISTRLIIDLRRQLFGKILQLPTHIFHEQSAGKLVSRLIYDTDNVNQAATNVLVTAVRETLTAVALLLYLLYLDWKLTLITLAIGPLIAFIIKGFSRRIRAASRASFEAIRAMSHTIEETTDAHKVIKIFGGQAQQQRRFFNDTERFRRSMMREAVPASALTPITHLIASMAVAGITYLALSQTTGQASASAGGFVSFIAAMLLLISPIKQLTAINPIMQRGLAACESVFLLLDQPDEEDPGQRELHHARGDIEFDRVSFSYPDTERQTLNEISFHVPAGQTVALVGASGGGKTTISALIPRFYRPSAGQIRIDGIDINELGLTSLRHNIALVSQDIVLFNDTVLANIAFGSTGDHTREDVVAAAKAANAWEFILQLPEGLDTPIGEDGAKLSGGQRQRIAIARALLKNAPILVLDEATSALDTESERQVQAALAVLMKNRTTLVIAHRLSTIEHANRILVLDRGRIVESGTHAELLAAGGYYANLNRMQT